MKILLLLVATLFVTQWEPDFENAKKTAKEKHQLILLNFSGSDWCAPCIAFTKDYLDSPAFQELAKENLVLVNADFPRRKKNQLPAEQVKRNETLADKYNKDGNFPYTLILDADGNVLKSYIGRPEKSVDQWVAEVKTICESHK
jgi:thiol-disulfide isomerase/thioredoxin